MPNYPVPAAAAGRVEPAPRRVRGYLDGRVVFDTSNAIYVWEWPHYPQYYIPVSDIDMSLLSASSGRTEWPEGMAETRDLQGGRTQVEGAVRIFGSDAIPGLDGTARFEWGALDAWFEEDEQIFVHPRNPYSRVDAIRSNRPVRVEVNGVVLADAPSSVIVFETGLPPRYYLERTAVKFENLQSAPTVSSCPYKGTTSGYWSARVGDNVIDDLAWAYDFPTTQMHAIAGRIAFYNEKVDIYLEGELLDRPTTHFV